MDNQIVMEGIVLKQYPYDGRYYVSECGKIWSSIKKIWMTPRITKLGYAQINILNPRTNNKMMAVHRIVAYTWIGMPSAERNEINHKDGNKLNNHVSNLEWCNRSENVRHGFDSGLFDLKRQRTVENNKRLWAEGKKRKAVEMGGLKRKEFVGEKHEQSKKCINIFTNEVVSCARELAEKLDMPYSTVRAKLNGRSVNNINWRYL